MAKNKIEKQKGALIGLSVAVTVISVLGFIGGVVLTIFGVINLVNQAWVPGILMTVFGVALIVLGIIFAVWGIRFIITGSAIKATEGSIAEVNLAKAGTVNGKKCPK
ncbi:MAG: hypothetical protein MJ239_07675, partial [Bacilli bacterium]|nr:hypothetical protein [Bacilli bacterium]